MRVHATEIKQRRFPNQFAALLAMLVCISGIGGGPLATPSAYADEPLAMETNTVWAWGWNTFGQVGDGTTVERRTPVQAMDLKDVVAVAGARRHSLAVRADGTVWAWGSNADGQLGDGTTTDRHTPVQTVGLTDIVAVACGERHSLALSVDGTVWAWGHNFGGRLGDGTNNPSLTPVRTVNLTNVVAITAGRYHSLALRADGTVWAWGSYIHGALGDGTTNNRTRPVQTVGLIDIVAIHTLSSHSLAVRADGTVWAWGTNQDGQLGDGTTTEYLIPVQTVGMSNAIAVATGVFHSLALRADGTVWAWGSNLIGQLGDGTTIDSHTPVQTADLSDVIAIGGGHLHSLALHTDGTVWGWGNNGNGQLGHGTGASGRTPVQTADLTNVLAIATGYWHGLAIVGNTNTPPVAVASIFLNDDDLGDFAEIPCDGHDGTLVTLNGSNSFDPDEDELEFEWSVAEDSGIAIDDPTAAITNAIFPLGVHQVTLTVYDLNDEGERKGQLGLASVTIVVTDNEPPVALVTTNLVALWPPNNKMVPVELLVVASDDCVAPEDLLVHCTITSSQHDDHDGSGEFTGDVDGDDGYTAPVEIQLLNLGNGEYAALVYLRAERDGDIKAGRIYSINVQALDLSGNVGHASTTVVVPHNQGKKN